VVLRMVSFVLDRIPIWHSLGSVSQNPLQN
jgi:hypothetical protein